MNIVDIYLGKDAYDFKRLPTHYRSEMNLEEGLIDAYLEQIVKEFKHKKFPWYLVTVTTFEVGGEVNTVHYHNAHPIKEKIILNKPAKDSQPKHTMSMDELLNGHHGLAVDINHEVPLHGFAAPPVQAALVAAAQAIHQEVEAHD